MFHYLASPCRPEVSQLDFPGDDDFAFGELIGSMSVRVVLWTATFYLAFQLSICPWFHIFDSLCFSQLFKNTESTLQAPNAF